MTVVSVTRVTYPYFLHITEHRYVHFVLTAIVAETASAISAVVNASEQPEVSVTRNTRNREVIRDPQRWFLRYKSAHY